MRSATLLARSILKPTISTTNFKSSLFTSSPALTTSSLRLFSTDNDNDTTANQGNFNAKKRNPLLGISIDQGSIHNRKTFKQTEDADDSIGVDYDGEWNMKSDHPDSPTSSLLDELNESFKLTGIGRKRKSSGLGVPEPKTVEEERDEYERAIATGSRKAAKATVYIKKGNGEHYVNGLPYIDYFPNITQRAAFVDPFMAIDKIGEFDVFAEVQGGGYTGQAGAIQLGISRALQKFDPSFRPPLRKGGFLTVDSRKVERKKPGRKKARKLQQWVKR